MSAASRSGDNGRQPDLESSLARITETLTAHDAVPAASIPAALGILGEFVHAQRVALGVVEPHSLRVARLPTPGGSEPWLYDWRRGTGATERRDEGLEIWEYARRWLDETTGDRILAVDDVHRLAHDPAEHTAVLLDAGVRAFAVAPVRAPNGYLICILHVEIHDLPRRWREGDLSLIRVVADLSAGILLDDDAALRLSTAFDDGPHPLTIRDHELRLLDCNDAFCELTGRTRRQLLGTEIAELVGHSLTSLQALKDLVGAGRDRLEFHETVQRPDGTAARIRADLTPVRTREGLVRAVIVHYTDLSELAASQDALLEKLELEELLSETAREYVEASGSQTEAAIGRALARFGNHWGAIEVGIHEFDLDANTITLVAEWAPRPDGWSTPPKFRSMPLDMAIPGLSGLTALRQPYIIDPDHHRLVLETVGVTQFDPMQVLVVPLLAGASSKGVLTVHLSQPHAWSDDELSTLQSLGVMTVELRNRVKAEEGLQLSEARLSNVIESAPALIARFDADKRLVYASPALEMLIPSVASQLGWSIYDLEPPVPPEYVEAVVSVLETGLPNENEFPVPLESGTVWVFSRSVPEPDADGKPAGVLSIAIDVTERQRHQAKLEHQATHDDLTGLINRAELRRILAAELAPQKEPPAVAILLIDLDRFRVLNDSMGHGAGDQLLLTMADRLRFAVRPGDTIARLGGDEFVVMLQGSVSEGEAAAVANRLLEIIAAPVEVDGQKVYATASIGIAFSHPADQDMDDILRHADAAMYSAKDKGRNRFAMFDQRLREVVASRLRGESELRGALERGEFEVHYQPEVDLVTGYITGAEALLRWRHPERGLIVAAEFITTAEETGLIIDLGSWVLREACRQLGEWNQRADLRPITLRVNLSAQQLTHPALLEATGSALAGSRLSSHQLCLEITETTLMIDLEESLRVLRRLHDLGINIAIDDFGTGFSSLSYLKQLPVDVLKIDRSFVVDLVADPEDTAIVATVIGLAEALGLETVAEGVDDPRQVAELRRLGCQRAQGFLLARPCNPVDMERYLVEGRIHV